MVRSPFSAVIFFTTYSIKKYIEYNGEEQNVNVFWDVEEFLYAGNYRLDIFEGGNLIGSQKFTLD